MPNYAENIVKFETLEDLEKVVAFTSQISEADDIYRIEYLGTKVCKLKNIGAKVGKSFPGLPEKMNLHLSDMYALEPISHEEISMLDIRKQLHVGDYLIYERVQNSLGRHYFSAVSDNNLEPYKTDFNFNMIVPQGSGVLNWIKREKDGSIYQPLNHPFLWYEWNYIHWGTKWKTFDVYIDKSNFTIEFQTANDGVNRVIEVLSMHFPNTKIKYGYETEDGYSEAFEYCYED